MKLGQVDLFTKRVRKPPPPKEDDTHRMLVRILERWAEPDCWWSHIYHGAHLDAAAAAKGKDMGVHPGIADFLFLTPRGVFWLELKRAGRGRLSPAQLDFRHAAQWAGCTYQVAYSVTEAIDILKDWGCLQQRIRVSA